MQQTKFRFLLLFSLFPFCLFAQKYAPIQIEFGTGIMSTLDTDLAAVVPFSIELKTQQGLFDFSLQYKKGVIPLGVDHPRSSDFLRHKRLFTTLASSEPDYLNRLSNWEAYQIWGDIHIKIGYFNPLIGVGVSINRINGFIKKENFPSATGSIDSYIVAPTYFSTLNLRLGYKFGNFRFYMESQVLKNSAYPRFVSLGTAVNVGLTSKREKEIFLFHIRKEEKHFAPLLFRIEFLSGYLFVLNNKRDASSLYGGVDMHYRIKGNHFIGVRAVIGSRNNGYDSDTQEIKSDFIVSNASQQLRLYTLYYRYNKQLNVSKAFFFGLGGGGYKVPTNLPIMSGNLNIYRGIVKFNTQSSFGMNVHFGIRNNLFSHSLTIHYLDLIPSPYPSVLTKGRFILEYKIGLGLSFHK